MHHYRRNIGDYHKKAGRLSILQHGVYNLLIDACYDRERFPTREEAIDWVWASTPEEEQAVDFILRKFFELRDGVYVQTRIEEELEEYRQFCVKQAEKGKNGGRPKKAEPLQEKPGGFSKEPSGKPVESQRAEIKTLTTNQLTTNQLTKEKHGPNAPDGDSPVKPGPPEKPATEKHRAKGVTKAEMRETFPELTDQTIDDWITARKGKGAKTLTVTAWNAVVNEIRISGLTGEQALQIAAARNWQGVKSEWLLSHIAGGQGPPRGTVTPAVSRNAQEIQAWLESGSDERH